MGIDHARSFLYWIKASGDRHPPLGSRLALSGMIGCRLLDVLWRCIHLVSKADGQSIRASASAIGALNRRACSHKAPQVSQR
jgi:hypothetical protein